MVALFQNNMSHTTFIYKLFYCIQLCDITKCQCTIRLRMDPVVFFSSRVCIVMIPLWRDWGQLPNSKTVWSHQYAMYFTWYVSFLDGFWGPFSGRARTIIIAITDTINQIMLSKPWALQISWELPVNVFFALQAAQFEVCHSNEELGKKSTWQARWSLA